MTSAKTQQTQIINALHFATPLGPMLACASAQGICLLGFTDQNTLETELNNLKQRLTAEVVYAQHPLFEPLLAQLTEYFQGQRKLFDLPLDMPGTPFQHQVWQALCEIPYGTTCSYGQQACNMGNPAAVRAVARANGMNRLAIIVPCHRVIGTDGKLVGYAGGLQRKQWLLELEQKYS